MDNYVNLAKKVIEKYPLSKGNFLEIRFFIGEFTNINIRNNASEQISNESKIGVALRALIDGAWGFSTSKNFTKRDLLAAMETAVNASKASAKGLKEKSGGFGLASCDVCHTRHTFSVKEASQPQACQTCHMGIDHPQWERSASG